jgi:hypothetical protein
MSVITAEAYKRYDCASDYPVYRLQMLVTGFTVSEEKDRSAEDLLTEFFSQHGNEVADVVKCDTSFFFSFSVLLLLTQIMMIDIETNYPRSICDSHIYTVGNGRVLGGASTGQHHVPTLFTQEFTTLNRSSKQATCESRSFKMDCSTQNIYRRGAPTTCCERCA